MKRVESPSMAQVVFMFSETKPLTAPAALLGCGLIAIFFATLWMVMIYIRRVATKQWNQGSSLDQSYGATLRRTFYGIERQKIQVYFGIVVYCIGIGLVIASGVVKLVK